MLKKKYTDGELMRLLEIDKKTLERFQAIRKDTIRQARKLVKRPGKIKVLGISGSARSEFGFAQENSNSEELLKRCLAHFEKLGAKTELVPLREYSIKPCNACYSTTNTQCHFYCSCYPKGTPEGDDMSNILYDKVLAADAIVFATPVNNFKMSTMMGAFIDRCISLDGSLAPVNPKSPKDKNLNIKHMKFIELTADNDIPGSGMLRRFSGKVAGVIVTGHEEGASMVISTLFMTLSHFGMLFPPFANMYAMASVCNSTYKDKEMVLGDCYASDLKSLAFNVHLAVKIAKKYPATAWKTDYRSN
ncbi:flavodoxin family protein [bacterium]|nr:MAG: flavodoxin family protein [bacterium]